jgi:hypothetical protein
MNWDEIYSGIRSFAGRAATKINQTADMAALQVKLSMAEHKLEEAYAALGRASFGHFVEDKENFSQISACITEVKNAMLEVRSVKQQIEDLKERAAKAEAAAVTFTDSVANAAAEAAADTNAFVLLVAAKELGLEDEETGDFTKAALELEPIRIGRWGQLQEWTEDVDDPGDRHRHISHLYALYPSAQITAVTPELEKASKVTLNARGDEATGWGVAWRACWWARLRDGERAHKILRGQLKPFRSSLGGYSGGTYPNLLDAHPPFQLDGNLGCVAAICEMLLQSHERTPDGRVLIRLLPACPRAWPDGEVTAFRARGGYSVSFRWSGGKVVSFKVSGGNAGGYEIKK